MHSTHFWLTQVLDLTSVPRMTSALIRVAQATLFFFLFVSTHSAFADSVLLDGSNDHVAIGHDAPIANHQFTIETWFKRASGGSTVLVNTTASYPLVARGNAANYFLGTDSSGRLHGQVMTASGGRISVNASVAVPIDEWHHGAFTYDGANLRLYVDGLQVGAKPLTGLLNFTPDGTRLGQIIYQGQTYGAWKGWIDETRIWNRALSQVEIGANRSKAVSFAPGLLARWGFEDNSNLTSVSDGANEISATLANGAAYSADSAPISSSVPAATIAFAAIPVSVVPGSTVPLTASATDPENSIVRVSFYANHAKIGEDDTAPYEMDWVPASTRLFLIRAVAEDANGLSNGSATGKVVAVTQSIGSDARYFDGEGACADAGISSALDLTAFTIETRFLIDGDGKPVPVGTNQVSCVALVSRGASLYDTNFLLGIKPAGNFLVGGFGNAKPMVIGQTPITRGVWHHAAVSFDGQTLRLFLDGSLEAETSFVPVVPSGGTKRLTLGALTTSNYATGPTLNGLFHGALDEVRIWNHARPVGAIVGSRSSDIPTAPGLLSRWSMDGGSGVLTGSGSMPLDATVFPRVAACGGPAINPGSVPTATLSSPADLTTVARNSLVTLQSTANDADGPIQRVEYWSQFGKLGESSVAPYSVAWPAGPVDTVLITAVPIGATGVAGSSQLVRVNVVPQAGSGGIYFDGIGDCGASESINIIGKRFTFEGCFRREGASQENLLTSRSSVVGCPIFALGEQNSFRAILGVRASDNALLAIVQAGTDILELAGPPIPVSSDWMHAAMTSDGNRIRVYLDGILVLEGALPPAFPNSISAYAYAAQGGEYVSNFKGFIDEFRIWDHERSATEIAGSRAQQFATASGLIARWTFNEGTGTSTASTASNPISLNLFQGPPVWTTGVLPATGVPPSATIAAPANQSAIPILQPFLVQVAANDPDGTVQKVEVYLDGTKVGEDTDAPYQIEITGQKIGAKDLRAVAIDNAGLSTTHRITLQMLQPVGGEGLYFDGTDDSVRMPSDAGLASDRFTVEAWICRDGIGKEALYHSGIIPIVVRGGRYTGGINFALGFHPTTGKLIGRMADSLYSQPAVDVTGITTIPFGRWHHIALTFDGAALRLFLDGQEDGYVATSIVPATGSQFTMLGSIPTSSYESDGRFHGYLDEVRIWNHARSQAAISADRWRTIFNDPSLLGCWAMDEGTGTQIASSGAVPATGTITGAQWTTGHPAFHTQAPSTTLSAGAKPAAGGSALLSAAPSSSEGIALVEFYANGAKIGETTGAPWSVQFTPASPGRYVITVVTTTASGAKGASNDLVWDVAPPAGAGGIYLDGIDDFVEMPAREELSLATVTVETWFRCEGPGRAGVYTNVGNSAPIIAHGNDWLIGIRPTDRKLVAGFNQNVRVSATTVDYGQWYHVALTGSGTTVKMYVNGVLEAESSFYSSLQRYSVSAATIGTSLNSEIQSQGSFHGYVDETRVWSVVRSAQEIAGNYQREIWNAPGLVGRWSTSDISMALDTGSNALHGRLRNGAVSAAGTALIQNPPPSVNLVAPAAGAEIPAPAVLSATVQGESQENLTTSFSGREIARDAEEFTIAVLPDVSNYTASVNGGSPATLNAMLDWVVANRAQRKIAAVAQTGGLAPALDTNAWNIASQAFAKLEDPAMTGLTYGIPYGLTRDLDGWAYFSQKFSASRFTRTPWYGDGTSDSYIVFFRAGGQNMALVLIKDFQSSAWLEKHLQNRPNCQFIIVQNDVHGASGVSATLQKYSNVALAIGGHSAGEQRVIVNANGLTRYHSLSANFEDRPNGGDGWLRLLTFSPLEGRIRVQTYSPIRGEFETDANSDFTVGWNSPLAGSFTAIGAPLASMPDDTATVPWNGTVPSRKNQWRTTVSDGISTILAPARTFSTASIPGGQPPSVAMTQPQTSLTATLPCVIPILATASSVDDAVERVELLVNGLVIDSKVSGPFQFFWYPGASGNYQISVAAVDRRGLRSETPPVAVNISGATSATLNVSISAPTQDSTLYDFGTIPISVTTSGTATVSYVDFYADGVYVGRDSSAPYSFAYSYSGTGIQRLQALAVATNRQSATSAFVRVSIVPLSVVAASRQPYLQMAKPNEVTVCWRSSLSHPARVRFGRSLQQMTSLADEESP